MDVTRCASGELVVIHDDTVDRTTNGSGMVSTLSLDTLQTLRAGPHPLQGDEGEPIPTLAQVLDAVGGSLLLNIEIKGMNLQDEGIERDVALLVRERGLGAGTLISSFNPLALRRMSGVAPELALALLYAPRMPIYLARAWARHVVKIAALHPRSGIIDSNWMRWARENGYWVNAWTVNTHSEMERLIDLGVDGIITDKPSVLRELLSRR